MVDITENFVTECLLKVQTFLESICGNMLSLKVVYGSGWMDKITKKRKKEKHFLLMKCSVSTQKNLVRDLHATDFLYHLDCWLGVTKIQAFWSSAIVTNISSIKY